MKQTSTPRTDHTGSSSVEKAWLIQVLGAAASITLPQLLGE
jgi:hypothetical protein